MSADSPVEKASDVVPLHRSRFRIKSLMIWVGLIALGLGWVLHTDRVGRSFQNDRTRFITWANEFEKDHPTLKPLGRSMTASSLFFEVNHRWNQDYQTPTGERISIQGVLKGGPFHTHRQLTFESPGRNVTWPFEDVERGRKVDLKAEFPGLAR